jgi:hypothetical protein
MASFNKYSTFIEKLFELGHDFQNDTFTVDFDATNGVIQAS